MHDIDQNQRMEKKGHMYVNHTQRRQHFNKLFTNICFDFGGIQTFQSHQHVPIEITRILNLDK